MAAGRIWIMDGHNMIFATRELQGLQVAGCGDEARRHLVALVRQFAHARREDALVVFDGDDLPRNPDVLREPFLEVVYAPRGAGGADARILNAARSMTNQGRRVTVVTDDVSTLASKLPHGADRVGVQAFRMKYLEAPADRAEKRVEGDFSDVEKELEALAAVAEPVGSGSLHRPRAVASPSARAPESSRLAAGVDSARELIRRKRHKGRLRQERMLKRRSKP